MEAKLAGGLVFYNILPYLEQEVPACKLLSVFICVKSFLYIAQEQ